MQDPNQKWGKKRNPEGIPQLAPKFGEEGNHIRRGGQSSGFTVEKSDEDDDGHPTSNFSLLC